MLRSYTPADALTIGNASCGTIAILLCLDYMAFGDHRRLWAAILLLPIALSRRHGRYVARLTVPGSRCSGPISIRLRMSSRSASRLPSSASRSACAAAGTWWC